MNLKILILLILAPLALFGEDYFFYVETPEMVDSYYNIFNGMAMIFHDENYGGLLRMVFLFGGFFSFVAGLVGSWGRDGKGTVSAYAKYLFVGVVILSILFHSESTLIVKSDSIPSYCTTSGSTTTATAIDNFPTILAYGFNFVNRFGREMTRLAETAYIDPSSPVSAAGNTAMSQSGGYAGSLKQSMAIFSTDLGRISLEDDQNGTLSSPVDIASMARNIYEQCILIPFSSKGEEGESFINNLKTSNNIEIYFSALYGGGTIIGGQDARNYTLEAGGEIWECGTYYDRMLTHIDRIKDSFVCTTSLSSSEIGGGALTIITRDPTPPVSTFKDVALQAGLIAELEKSTNNVGIGVSGVNYASGKSRAEFIQSNMATGSYMAEMLPFLQMTLRAILYSFFPFVFVVVLLPGGLKVITQYMQSLLWIELWSPTAAILNMFISKQAEYEMGGEYSKHGMTLMNSVEMMSSGSTIAGVAGYLYASVPALTWLILKGSAQMLGSVTGAVASGVGKNIQTDAINKDTKELSELKNFNNRKTGEEFSLSEMQHYQSVQAGTVAGSTLAVEHKSGAEAVAGQAGFKRAGELEAFKQKAEYFGLNGTDANSLTQMGGAYAAPSSFQDGIKMQTMQSLDKPILAGAMNTEVNKGSATLQAGALANNNGLSQDEYIASEMKKYQQNYSDKAYMNTQRNAHKEILNDIDDRIYKQTGKHLTEDEKDFMAAARGGQSLGKYAAMDSVQKEQFVDLVTGKTANTIDSSLTGQKVMGADSDAALFSYGLRQGTSAKFDKDVNLLKNEELSNDGVGPAKVAHAQTAQTEIGIGAVKGKETVAKALQGDAGARGLINQATEDNLSGKKNVGGHTMSYGFNKNGGVTYKDNKTGETWSGESTAVFNSIAATALKGMGKDQAYINKHQGDFNKGLQTITETLSKITPITNAGGKALSFADKHKAVTAALASAGAATMFGTKEGKAVMDAAIKSFTMADAPEAAPVQKTSPYSQAGSPTGNGGRKN